MYDIALQYSILRKEVQHVFGVDPAFLIYSYMLYKLLSYINIWTFIIKKLSLNSNNKGAIYKIIKNIEYKNKLHKDIISLGDQLIYNNLNISQYSFDYKNLVLYSIYQTHSDLSGVFRLNLDIYYLAFMKKGFCSVDNISKDNLTIVEPFNEESEEIVVPTNISENIVNKAISISNEICKEFYDKKQSQIYIFSGPTGCGKTTTARIIANGLNAMLFSEYSPIRENFELWSVYNYVSVYNNRPLVVTIEEFDIVLEAINDKSGVGIKENRSKCDIVDKMSWNNTFDKVKRKQNIVMILTTNKTIKEIRELCCDDSLIRKHRVDGFYIFDNNNNYVFENALESGENKL